MLLKTIVIFWHEKFLTLIRSPANPKELLTLKFFKDVLGAKIYKFFLGGGSKKRDFLF